MLLPACLPTADVLHDVDTVRCQTAVTQRKGDIVLYTQISLMWEDWNKNGRQLWRQNTVYQYLHAVMINRESEPVAHVPSGQDTGRHSDAVHLRRREEQDYRN